MKTNVTVKIDTAVARDAKVLAARRGTSLSRLVAEHLNALVREDRAFARARRHALRQLKEGFDLGWQKPDDRAALHDRKSLR